MAPDARLPFISIIVPAYNEGPMIAQVLESLQRVRYPRFEVVVVDDGSSDQTFLRALPFGASAASSTACSPSRTAASSMP